MIRTGPPHASSDGTEEAPTPAGQPRAEQGGEEPSGASRKPTKDSEFLWMDWHKMWEQRLGPVTINAHLSFGQRRRVAVATVLAMKPEILVLDEPSSNLDPASRRELADILRSLDITIVMVTHDLPYAHEICARSVILNGGIIVADGPTQSILTNTDLLAANRLELPVGFVI